MPLPLPMFSIHFPLTKGRGMWGGAGAATWPHCFSASFKTLLLHAIYHYISLAGRIPLAGTVHKCWLDVGQRVLPIKTVSKRFDVICHRHARHISLFVLIDTDVAGMSSWNFIVAMQYANINLYATLHELLQSAHGQPVCAAPRDKLLSQNTLQLVTGNWFISYLEWILQLVIIVECEGQMTVNTKFTHPHSNMLSWTLQQAIYRWYCLRSGGQIRVR